MLRIADSISASALRQFTAPSPVRTVNPHDVVHANGPVTGFPDWQQGRVRYPFSRTIAHGFFQESSSCPEEGAEAPDLIQSSGKLRSRNDFLSSRNGGGLPFLILLLPPNSRLGWIAGGDMGDIHTGSIVCWIIPSFVYGPGSSSQNCVSVRHILISYLLLWCFRGLHNGWCSLAATGVIKEAMIYAA